MGDKTVPERTFAIPTPSAGFGDARWVPAGETVKISDVKVPGGMLYVGAQLKAANGSTEPSLICGRLNVARHGDFRERHTNYWPSYAEISATARRAYLNWLAEGRTHPDCDIGLVFLFFYGLERRVILDTANNDSIKTEWPAIAGELRRLLAIYGERSGSFRRYAVELDGAGRRIFQALPGTRSFLPTGLRAPRLPAASTGSVGSGSRPCSRIACNGMGPAQPRHVSAHPGNAVP